jgi:hypothetical protein
VPGHTEKQFWYENFRDAHQLTAYSHTASGGEDLEVKETAANPGSVAVGFVVGTVAMKASVTSQKRP